LEKVMAKIAVVVLAISCLLLSGCATVRSAKEFENASIGMSKYDVVKKVGRPAIVRGTLKNKDCETVEVWEYKAGKGKDLQQVSTEMVFTFMSAGSGAPLLISAAETDRYWVYFINGAYAGWSRAGDWARDQDKLRDMQFRPRESISKII
jgi:hypothetical protein